LLLVLAGVLRLLEEQKNLAAGCVLALGLFKFHLVLPLAAILILRRRLSFLAGFISIAFVEGLISIALVGWSGTLDYPGYLLRTSFGSGTGMTTWHNMPNLRAILTGLSGSRIPLWLGVLVMGAGVIFVTRLWRESAPESPQLLHASFSLAIATTILTSYYAYTYDLALLAIPILIFQGVARGGGLASHHHRVLLMIAIALLTFTPLYWVVGARTHFLYLASSVPLFLMTIALASALRSNRT